MRHALLHLLFAGMLALPAAAGADDAKPAQTPMPASAGLSSHVRDLIDAVTEAADRNPHTCFEEEGDAPERPDLADRPQS